MKPNELQSVMNKTKGEILSYFEMVCPTDSSFNSVKRKIHREFDELAVTVLRINEEQELLPTTVDERGTKWTNSNKGKTSL